MKSKQFFTACLLTFAICSCADLQKESKDSIMEPTLQTSAPDDMKQESGPPESQQRVRDTLSIQTTPTQRPAPMDWDKKIIKTAELRLEVPDHKKFNTRLNDLIRQAGGYIAAETQRSAVEQLETSLTIKVPVATFETILNQLPGDDIKLLERNITSEDVTGEVVDTRSRLESKGEVRLKYLEFLKAAKNIDEVLKVQKEINDIQENMEAAKARVGYLSHQSAFSTIHLTYYQALAGFEPKTGEPSFGTRIVDSFNSGATWLAGFFVGLVSIWPLLLMLAIGIFIYRGRTWVTAQRRKP
ncbi:MAG: DUF4349 domain-containing protein [Bacteroidota bacterium]